MSSLRKVTSVAQDSVLGSVLFLIYDKCIVSSVSRS